METDLAIPDLVEEIERLRKRVRELETDPGPGEPLSTGDRYRSLLDQTRMGIGVVQEGRIKFINASALSILGLSPEEVSAKSFTELIHPEDRAMVVENHRRRLMGREAPPSYCFRALLPDGTVRLLELRSSLIDWDGAPATLNLVFDVSESQLAANLLSGQLALGPTLSGDLDKDEVLRSSLEAAIKITGLEVGGLYLVDARSGHLELTAAMGIDPGFRKAISRIERGSEQAALIMAGKPVYLDQAETAVLFRETYPKEYSTPAAVAVVPILREGRVVGCLKLASYALFEIDPAHRRTVESCATLLSAVVTRILAEEQLQRSEIRFETVFDNAAVGMVLTDLKGGFIRINDKICQMLGYDRSRVMEMNLADVCHPQDLEVWDRIRRRMLAGEMEQGRNEIRLVGKKGRLVWAQVGVSLIRDEKGNALHFSSQVMDITDSKAAREAHLEIQAHLQSLMVNATQFAIYRLAVDESAPYGLKVVLASPSIIDLLDPEDPLDLASWFEAVHPDDRERVIEANVRAHETNLFNERGRIWHRSKKEWRWLHVSSNAIMDVDGRPTFINGIVIDVTDQMRAEEALRESENRYRTLFQDSPVSLWEIDMSRIKAHVDRLERKGTVDLKAYFKENPSQVFECLEMVNLIAANKATLDLSEARNIEEMTAHMDRIMTPSALEFFIESVAAFSQGQTVFQKGYRRGTTSGGAYDVEAKLSILPGHERDWSRVVQLALDTTERVRTEAALKEIEEHFRSLMESATDFVIFRHAFDQGRCDRGKVVFASPSITRLLAVDDPLNLDEWYTHVPPEAQKRLAAAQRQAAKNHNYNQIFQVDHPDRGPIWMQIVATIIPDKKGRPRYSNGIIIDVTDRIRAGQALKESQELFSLFMNNLPGVAFIKDLEGRYAFYNQACRLILGRDLPQVIGKTDHDLWPAEIADQLRSNDRMILTEDEPLEFVETIVTPSGIQNWLTSKFLIHKEGRPVFLAGVGIDITLRVKAEQSLREKEQELLLQAKRMEESNIALKVILKHQDEERGELGSRVLANVKNLVIPYLDRIERQHLTRQQASYLQAARTNLGDIVSPFAKKLSSKYFSLTPREMEVARMVRDKKSTAEIAELFNISENAIAIHRKNIRAKLGLKNKKVNLASYLQALEDEP